MLAKPRILNRLQETLQQQDVEGFRQELIRKSLSPPKGRGAESLGALCTYLEQRIQGLGEVGPPAPLSYQGKEDSVYRTETIKEKEGLSQVSTTSTDSVLVFNTRTGEEKIYSKMRGKKPQEPRDAGMPAPLVYQVQEELIEEATSLDPRAPGVDCTQAVQIPVACTSVFRWVDQDNLKLMDQEGVSSLDQGDFCRVVCSKKLGGTKPPLEF